MKIFKKIWGQYVIFIKLVMVKIAKKLQRILKCLILTLYLNYCKIVRY